MQLQKKIGRKGLKTWALSFLSLWVLARALTRGLLGAAAGEELKALLDSSSGLMHLSAGILILEALSTCGVVLYAAMALEGVSHTENIKNYILRVSVLALVSEIPYDLLMTGSPVHFGAQNPAFGFLVCLLTIYYWNLFSDSGGKYFLLRLAVFVAAFVWCVLLKVEFGRELLISTAVLWLFRKDSSRWGIGGMLAGGLCILLSPFFLAAPMGAMILHFYNGEEKMEKSIAGYMAYPLILLTGWIVSSFL